MTLEPVEAARSGKTTDPDGGSGPPQERGRRLKPPSLSRAGWLTILVLIEVVVVSIIYPDTFFSEENLRAILRNNATDAILAVGMMMLLVSGMFDLSVGSMWSLSGVLAGWLMVNQGVSVPLAILLTLAAAAFGGFLNGVVVARVGVNALITTLATLGIFSGMAVLIAGPGISALPDGFLKLGQSELLGIQLPVYYAAAIALLFHFALARTRFFRQYYYIGGNPKAALLSGINVPRMQVLAFTLMGLLAGIAGVAFAARVGSSVSVAGVGAELRVITAVILGGASLTGGKGTVWGALIGVLFIALIQNILVISAVSSTWQSIVIGAVLITAVALDSTAVRSRFQPGARLPRASKGATVSS